MSLHLYLKKWTAIGCKPYLTSDEEARVVMINCAALIMAVPAIPYFFIFCILKAYLLAFLIFPFIFLYSAGVLIANHFGARKFAKYLLLLGSSAAVGTFTLLMGQQCGLEFVYIAIGTFAIVAFPPTQKIQQIFALSIPAISFFFLDFFSSRVPPYYHFSPLFFHILFTVSIATSFFVSTMCIRTYMLLWHPKNKETIEAAEHATENKVMENKNLSCREKEIVRLILEGKSNSEIGKSLFISESTVKVHLNKIYKKLEIRSRLELMRLHVAFAET